MENIQNTILRFFQGKANSEELKSLDEWSENRTNLKDLSDLQKIWIWSGLKPTSKPQINFDDTWRKIEKRHQSKKANITTYLKYAAVVLLTLNIGWWSAFYFLGGKVDSAAETFEVAANFEYNSVVSLPDNTIVHLRPGTKIHYNSDFNKNDRNIRLEGEAYFDVAKNSRKPFFVNMEFGKVKVLGTKFNICAEKNPENYQTTLVEGKVEFITNHGKNFNMKPNQLLEFDIETNKVYIKKVETDLYTAWKDGKIIFRDEYLGDITTKLEKIYNVKFIYRNADLSKGHKFAGTFHRETSIGEVLTMLKLSIPMKVSREERFPNPDLIYLE